MGREVHSGDSAAVQAWLDPKNRRLVYDLSTLEVGLLTASTEAVAFVAPPGKVILIAELSHVQMKWSPLALKVHISIDGKWHRIYFTPPKSTVSLGSAPTLGKKEQAEIGELFSTSTRVAELAGAHGNLFDSLSSLSESIEIAGLIAQAFVMYEGAKSYNAVHKVLADR